MSAGKKCRAAFHRIFPVAALACAQALTLPSASSACQRPAAASTEAATKGLAGIQNYISEGWNRLTRSMTSCASLRDVKATGPLVLYLPAAFPVP